MNLGCAPVRVGLEKFILYQTRSWVYVVGCDKRQLEYRVLKLSRSAEIEVSEDASAYSKFELKEMLQMIHEGNRTQGGLKRLATGYGIVGVVKFLDNYYLCLISQRRKVGLIGANAIYGIKNIEMIALKPEKTANADQSVLKALVSDVHRRLNPTQREIAEQRYLGLFQFLDLTKDFFFSYTYDLTRTLQHNMTALPPLTSAQFKGNPPARDMFTWNAHLAQSLIPNDTLWVVHLIHGAFAQRKCSFFGKIVNLALVARRSRYFAGTRYLKRGVSDTGHVANDVEIEQIVHEEGAHGIFFCLVQVRGSIPIYWTQETSVTMPKPPIILNRIDPTYTATRLHFADLFTRYAAPIIVLDLTKQSEKREREMIVSNEYRQAIEHLNVDAQDSAQIRYCALDFSQISKHRELNVLDSLEDVAKWSLQETNFFCSYNNTFNKQLGAVRTNCIDCLDRTNVAQFTIGAHALSQMLAFTSSNTHAILESSNQAILILMELYSTVGDSISLQYGGSEAHKKMSQQSDISTTKHKELLTSIRRYYSNAFTDRLKQDAINVFLGNFVPGDSLDLWELDSDYYLHNFHVQTGTVLSMKAQRAAWLSASSSESDSSQGSEEEEESQSYQRRSRGRARVERRCQRQKKILQQWWRTALAEFQSIPTDFDAPPPELTTIMTQFERMYQPHKLTQFDKLFAHEFSVPLVLAKQQQEPPPTPISSSTGSQTISHQQKNENTEIIEENSKLQRSEDTKITLRRFVRAFIPRSSTSIDHEEQNRSQREQSDWLQESSIDSSYNLASIPFVGSSDPNHDDTYGEAEYGEYVRCAMDPSRLGCTMKAYEASPAGANAYKEFAVSLKENDMRATDVQAVYESSRQAGIAYTIPLGRYEGLPQSVIARDVVAIVYEELDAVTGTDFSRLTQNSQVADTLAASCVPRLRKRSSGNDALSEQDALSMYAFPQTNFDVPGIISRISYDLSSLSRAKPGYFDYLTAEHLASARSRYSTTSSIILYCTYFNMEERFADRAMLHILHESFESKEDNYSSSQQQEQAEEQNKLSVHFDQIATDLYARRNNKFMLFNEIAATGAVHTQMFPKKYKVAVMRKVPLFPLTNKKFLCCFKKL